MFNNENIPRKVLATHLIELVFNERSLLKFDKLLYITIHYQYIIITIVIVTIIILIVNVAVVINNNNNFIIIIIIIIINNMVYIDFVVF
jgi:hypothetical protein